MAGAPVDFGRLRMNSMYGPTGGGGTGYRLYDTFLSSVLPLVKSARSKNRAYDERLTRGEREYKTSEREAEQNFTLQRDKLQQIGEMQMMRKKRDLEGEGGPNVFYDRFNEISAKDRAALALQERGLDIREDIAGEKSELEQAKLEEAKRKAGIAEGQKDRTIDIQEWKAKHPNKQIKLGDDGNLYAIGPDGPAELVTDKFGKPISQLTPREKLSIERDYKMEGMGEEARLRQLVEEALIRQRGEEARKNITATGEQQRTTQAQRPLTPQQQSVDTVNRAQEFKANNYDLAQWIDIDPDTGMVEITPPSNEKTWFGSRKGPTPEEYRRMIDGIHGRGARTPTTGPGSSSSGQRTPPTGAKPGGTWVKLPSGKEVYREP